MTPAAIVRQALAQGLSIVAICDHNAADNAAAAQRAAKSALTVLAGIEIETAEEAHVIGIFPNAEAACRVSTNVKETLPPLENPPSWMGEQAVVSESGERIGRETKMLSAASTFALEEAVLLIHEHEGIAIAAHVDRPSFSVTSQLGFIPEGAGFDALEISAAGAKKGRMKNLQAFGLPLVASSDSHYLSDIGEACTTFEMVEPSFYEMFLALRGRDGRRCILA
jgi:3',5'-nucleoside bisphosphate phosphatase